jgi:hypothetical protein
MDIVIAQFESRSFSFAAYGRNEDEARVAFNRGVDEHRRQFGARVDPAWVAEAKAEIEFKTVSFGVCYRDGESSEATLACLEPGPVR